MTMTPAQPITTRQLLRPAEEATLFAGWDAETHGHNRAWLCAELSRLAYAPWERVISTLERVGFSEAQPLLEPGGIPRSRAGASGFVARSPALGVTCVVFRGTEAGSFEDAVTDLLTLPVEWSGGGRVHTGFSAEYVSLRPRLQELLRGVREAVVVTGHSLGGALANLAATEFPCAELRTFGAPRVGNAEFAALLAGVPIERYVNCCDLVARVPPESFTAGALQTLLNGFVQVDVRGLTIAEQIALSAARHAADLAAQGLAKVLAQTGVNAEFVHAGPAIYIDREGRLRREPDPEWVRRDQMAGRGLYRGVVHEAMPALNLQRVFERLASLARLSLGGAGQGALEEFKGLFHDLARTATLANVVIRDLADHAPAAYIESLRSPRTLEDGETGVSGSSLPDPREA